MIGPCEEYGYNAVGKGWHRILKELDEKLIKLLGSDIRWITVHQIKEKFGTLRVYLDMHESISQIPHNKINDLIEEMEMSSSKICEICSCEGRSVKTNPLRGKSWMLTLCDACRYVEEVNVPPIPMRELYD